MRILIRTSKRAIWARRLGSFALPLLVLSVLMHRSEMMATEPFHLVVFLSLVLAMLAFVLGLIAFVELWFSGDKGWTKAFNGIFLGGICLAPLVFAAIEWQRYPLVYDVSTNPELLLHLQTPRDNPSGDYEVDQTAINFAFPNVITREYRISAGALYGIVETLAIERQWKILGKKSFLGGIGNIAEINVRAMTMLGWRDEVAIRVTNRGENGASVDMRSASALPGHDFGRNGKRIEEFLIALDKAVTEYTRDNLAIEPLSVS